VVLVEVLVEVAGDDEQAADVAVAGFRAEPGGRDEVVAMSAVLPAALFGDRPEDLDRGTSAILGCLSEVAGDEFRSGLLQRAIARLSMLLGGHLGIVLLLLQVSNKGVLGRWYGRGLPWAAWT